MFYGRDLDFLSFVVFDGIMNFCFFVYHSVVAVSLFYQL